MLVTSPLHAHHHLTVLMLDGACAVWSGGFAAIGFAALVCAIAQQFSFGLMGQRLTQRMRHLLLASALRQVSCHTPRFCSTYDCILQVLWQYSQIS